MTTTKQFITCIFIGLSLGFAIGEMMNDFNQWQVVSAIWIIMYFLLYNKKQP